MIGVCRQCYSGHVGLAPSGARPRCRCGSPTRYHPCWLSPPRTLSSSAPPSPAPAGRCRNYSEQYI
eukprot:9006617-Pyramimonas_sp.AAC.1